MKMILARFTFLVAILSAVNVNASPITLLDRIQGDPENSNGSKLYDSWCQRNYCTSTYNVSPVKIVPTENLTLSKWQAVIAADGQEDSCENPIWSGFRFYLSVWEAKDKSALEEMLASPTKGNKFFKQIDYFSEEPHYFGSDFWGCRSFLGAIDLSSYDIKLENGKEYWILLMGDGDFGKNGTFHVLESRSDGGADVWLSPDIENGWRENFIGDGATQWTGRYAIALEGTANDVPKKGDTNSDGSVDFDDIDPFVSALIDQGGYREAYPDCDVLTADLDDSGNVDFDDIDPFIEKLIG